MSVSSALAVAAAVGCSSNDPGREVSATTIEVTTTVRTTKAGPFQAWCEQLDTFPEALGSVAELKRGELSTMVDAASKLRDLSPPEAKGDFEVLVDFVTKASEASQSGAAGTGPDGLRRWASTYGSDGMGKVARALDHITQVQDRVC